MFVRVSIQVVIKTMILLPSVLLDIQTGGKRKEHWIYKPEEREKNMKLEGSCYCGAVRFECESRHPYPYQLCYCSICRKTAGGGGYAINLSAVASSLSLLKGDDDINIYQATVRNPEDSTPKVSSGRRRFCKKCGSMLWLDDPTWPELIHPFASCIDTPLPLPPERTHLMLDFKPAWVTPTFGPNDKRFLRYPEESIENWHKRLNLECS